MIEDNATCRDALTTAYALLYGMRRDWLEKTHEQGYMTAAVEDFLNHPRVRELMLERPHYSRPHMATPVGGKSNASSS